jgi:hypothetical protein
VDRPGHGRAGQIFQHGAQRVIVSRRRQESAGARSAPKAASPAAESGPSTIRVLAVYTPGVSKTSADDIQTLLDNLFTGTNQMYADSNVDLRYVLADTLRVNYGDGEPIYDALNSITGFDENGTLSGNPTFIQKIRNARAAARADLVMLLRLPEKDLLFCGLGWVGGIGGGTGHGIDPAYFRPSYGYVVVDAGIYCDSTMGMAHELAHNLGAAHQKDVDEKYGGALGAFGYSHGYEPTPTSATIMVDDDNTTTQLDVFSSPELTCEHVACGTAIANNAKSLNETRSIPAGYAERAALQITAVDGLNENIHARPGTIMHVQYSAVAPAGRWAEIDLMQNGSLVKVISKHVPIDPVHVSSFGWTILSSLAAGTYELRLRSTANKALTAVSPPIDIHTGAPVVNYVHSGVVGDHEATLMAYVVPNAPGTTGMWRIFNGANEVVASTKPAELVADLQATPVNDVDGLDCYTHYTARYLAQNDYGNDSNSFTFQTVACGSAAPSATDIEVTQVDSRTATIAATVSPGGFSPSAFLVYGQTASYGRMTDYQGYSTTSNVAFTLRNLLCGHSYHAAMIAVSASGAGTSNDISFATTACRVGTIGFRQDALTVEPQPQSLKLEVNRNGGAYGTATIDYVTAMVRLKPAPTTGRPAERFIGPLGTCRRDLFTLTRPGVSRRNQAH